ncbi:DUF1684 domain-containing protein [Gemmatimonadota bacterium]
MRDKKFFFKKLVYIYFIIGIVIFLDCSTSKPVPEDYSSYVSSIKKWHEKRIESLKVKNGILSAVGLYWLKEGVTSFGSNPSNDIVFPKDKAPEFIGSFTLHKGHVRIKIKPGVEVLHHGEAVSEMELIDDSGGEVTLLDLGPLSWFIIKRNEEFAVRLRDSENSYINQFKDIETFAIDPAWRLEARFEPFEQTKTIVTTTASGATRYLASPGSLIFKISNETYKLDVMNGDNYFLIFVDNTNGDETYEAGRFLSVEKPGADGTTIIDFNKAYNPPCALNKYYACPLPPPQNRLPVKVTAGEKNTKVVHIKAEIM